MDRTKGDNIPSIDLSFDNKFIIVPVQIDAMPEMDSEHYRYDVYRLPLSTWLHRWPWLAAWMVLGLFISQGFRRCRAGYWLGRR